MDIYSPAKLQKMTRKQLQEARADIVAEIADLEAVPNRSSVQELGLRNFKASLEIADETLQIHGDGSIITGGMPSTGGTKARRSESEKYMTLETKDGSTVYAVSSTQRLVDVPGCKPVDEPNALGQLIRASVLGDKSGLSAEVRAVLDESNGVNYTIPSKFIAETIDLARAQSVLSNAGMLTIPIENDGAKFIRVLADPVFSTKIKNNDFAEDDSMQLGLVTVVPRMLGCLIRVAREDAEDSANFSTLVQRIITKAFAQSIDNFGLNGVPGTQSPRGLFSFSEILNTDFETLTSTTVSAAALSVKNRNHIPSAAIMTVTDDHAISELKDSTGQWLGLSPALKDTSIYASTQVPANRFAIGDFSKFALGLRTSLRIESTDVGAGAFEKNQRVFAIYWRGDFMVLDHNAFQFGTITG
jgi:HK97 family phage major capsid protein